VYVCVTLSKTVAFLHEKGFYHRDLKPSNLLLTDPPRMVLKLCDLGLGALTSPERGGQLVTSTVGVSLRGNRPG
jgi:serine/threonine protein kinase